MNMLRYFGLIILCCVWACTPAENPTPTQSGATPSPSASNAPQPAITILADDLALPEPEILSEAEWLELTQSELVDAINAYGIKQFQAHYAAHADQNTLFSPFSVGWNLLIQANLAQGQAREQLLSQMELKDHDLQRINRLAGLLRREVYRNGVKNIYISATQDYVEESVLRADPVHGLWLSPDTEISAETVDALHQNYGVRVVKADFKTQPAAVAEALNAWIQARTRGEMPGQWQPEQVAKQKNLLWSTFYFQGLWENAFPRSIEDNRFQVMPFQLPTGETLDVPSLSAYSPLLFYREDPATGTSILSRLYSFVGNRKVDYNLGLQAAYESLFILPLQSESVSDEVNRFSTTRWQDMFVKWKYPGGTKTYPAYSDSTYVEIPQFEILSTGAHISTPFLITDNTVDVAIQNHPFPFRNLKRGTFNLPYGPELSWAYEHPGSSNFEATRPFLFSVYHRELRLILNIGTVVDPRGGNQP